MKLLHALGAAAFAALISASALAQSGFGGDWNTLPAWTGPLTGNEWFPADTHLPQGVQPQTAGYTPLVLGAFLSSSSNVLIGGDATTNLFVHGTSGASVSSTTPIYGGPNNFAYWSGASTALTVSRDTTAADLPATYQAAFKMARTSGQTGILPVCIAQEVETVNSIQMAGRVVEFDFHADAGANFSAAGSIITASIISGTGTDQGTASLQAATWTGQANAVSLPITISTTNTRYVVVGTIPAAATEVAVQICWTPTGTAGTNDYVALAGLQLNPNKYLASFSGTGGSTAVIPAAPFQRRTQALETVMQQRYAFAIAEANTVATVQAFGLALGSSTTVCSATIPFPVTMRAAPSYTNTLTATTFTITSSSQAATALGTPFSATKGANTVNAASINFTTTGMTAKDACMLTSTAAGSGSMLWTAEL
jgi:hypothetical protein